MEVLWLVLIGFAIFLGLQNQSRLAELHRRLEQFEAGTSPAPKAKAPEPEPRPAPIAPPSVIAPPVTPPPVAARSASAGPSRTSQPDVPKQSLEERLGTRWTVWVGGLSLALGGIFLVRYSIEAGLLGPGARIFFGALFSALLVGAGEWFRRKEGPVPFGIPSAHIPSVLTAAGTVAAFATVYSAHALYGFIGPASAFVLLGAIGIACILAAALHGPWLAGLGLVGAMVTPVLVSSDEPSAWALFIHVTVVTGASLALARLRDWRWLAVAATVLAFLWGLFFILDAGDAVAAEAAFIFAITLLLFGYHMTSENDGKPDVVVSILIGAFGFLATLLLVDQWHGDGILVIFTALIALQVLGAWKLPRLTPILIVSLAMSVCAAISWDLSPQLLQDPTTVFPGPGETAPMASRLALYLTVCAIHGALFLASGIAVALSALKRPARIALSWAGLATLGPLLLLAAAYWWANDLTPEVRYAAVAAALAAAYVALTARFIKYEADYPVAEGPTGVFAAGASSALALGVAMVLRDGYLTIALSLLAAGLAWVYSMRPIWALRILALVAAAIVIVCTAASPLVIDEPGTTPIFNALLWGYGIPALAFAAAAVLFRRSNAAREAGVFEALALLYTALLLFFEIRHWAQGGDMFAPNLSLYETGLQAMTAFLLAIAVNRLNLKSASPVFGAAVKLAGLAGIALSVLSLIVTNPLISGEEVGDGPFLAALFLGYLAPAIAAAIYALKLRGHDGWQAPLGAGVALVLTLAYVSLEVRSAFHAPTLVAWQMSDAEQYTYSAAWLILGIALLIAGGLLRSRVIRLGSALVIVLVGLKVFLIDMGDLTGILRALSFMGLGLVLVGIGVIYQRLLFPSAAKA
ncbi:membrane protein [Terrihabitans soli]|uniref:Membrane protein n=1 Tax=Terrihabitans soli TaxID=708113 RepID=A0A6S6QSF3_9HYPH|nr:DUF2339 domain-containing protein [Terrihabitans soli]BCJ90202.1 membrane protein [Terrihabitans soli]